MIIICLLWKWHICSIYQLPVLNTLHPQISHNIKTTDKWSECHWSSCYDATFCWCGFWCTQMCKPLKTAAKFLGQSTGQLQMSCLHPPTDQSTIITIFCRFVSLFWLNWCITIGCLHFTLWWASRKPMQHVVMHS